jgi:hypothetical protein
MRRAGATGTNTVSGCGAQVGMSGRHSNSRLSYLRSHFVQEFEWPRCSGGTQAARGSPLRKAGFELEVARQHSSKSPQYDFGTSCASFRLSHDPAVPFSAM